MKVSDHGLVLAACGNAATIAPLLAGAAQALAPQLGLRLEQLLSPEQPQQALAALTAGGGGGGAWLAPLPLDPGLALADGSHWAEALGAWRQPTLLLIDAAQLDTGLPAAATALLERWRVPLVGLIQWTPAAAWQEQARRRDGLPWLGWCDPEAGAGESLVPALRLRWQACLTNLA
jgi:hypothetical protein